MFQELKDTRGAIKTIDADAYDALSVIIEMFEIRLEGAPVLVATADRINEELFNWWLSKYRWLAVTIADEMLVGKKPSSLEVMAYKVMDLMHLEWSNRESPTYLHRNMVDVVKDAIQFIHTNKHRYQTNEPSGTTQVGAAPHQD